MSNGGSAACGLIRARVGLLTCWLGRLLFESTGGNRCCALSAPSDFAAPAILQQITLAGSSAQASRRAAMMRAVSIDSLHDHRCSLAMSIGRRLRTSAGGSPGLTSVTVCSCWRTCGPARRPRCRSEAAAMSTWLRPSWRALDTGWQCVLHTAAAMARTAFRSAPDCRTFDPAAACCCAGLHGQVESQHAEQALSWCGLACRHSCGH
jgi:hypothetical protein